MPKRSAGLLPFRVGADRAIELFIVHPGGPFWATRDEGAWSVAKGEYGEDEEPASAKDLRQAILDDGNKIGLRSVQITLTELVGKGLAQQAGRGTKTDPFLFKRRLVREMRE